MMHRDLIAEAHEWRDQLGRWENRADLYDALVPLSDTTLVIAYQLWWGIYSRGIQDSPSNKPGYGVSGEDSRRSRHLADVAVLSYLNNDF
jgi:hypothetical protein